MMNGHDAITQAQQIQIPPTLAIHITLEAQEWNIVMEVLYDGRFRAVAPIVQKLGEQLQRSALQHHQDVAVTSPIPDGVA